MDAMVDSTNSDTNNTSNANDGNFHDDDSCAALKSLKQTQTTSNRQLGVQRRRKKIVKLRRWVLYVVGVIFVVLTEYQNLYQAFIWKDMSDGSIMLDEDTPKIQRRIEDKEENVPVTLPVSTLSLSADTDFQRDNQNNNNSANNIIIASKEKGYNKSLMMTTSSLHQAIPELKSNPGPRKTNLNPPIYDRIIHWDVSPNFTDFADMPIRQFCQWRKGSMYDRRSVGKHNQWQIMDRVRIESDSITNNNNNNNITDYQYEYRPVIQQHQKNTDGTNQSMTYRNGDVMTSSVTPLKRSWQQMYNEMPNNVLLDVSFDCYQTMKQSPFGTGNWVQLIYVFRLAVAGMTRRIKSNPANANIHMDLKLSCRDPLPTTAEDKKKHYGLVMPHLMGHFSSTETLRVLNDFFTEPVNLKCHLTGWGELPIAWMLPWIRSELRKMAITLVGLPQDDLEHPAHKWNAEQNNVQYSHQNDGQSSIHKMPIIPNVQLDDTVIHFRCGDIMLSKELYFRFFKYYEFVKRIDPNRTKSIGIVTQPFGKDDTSTTNATTFTTPNDQARDRDQANPQSTEVCRRVIVGFQRHLQEKFPSIRVSIYNDPDETVALAYARLVMAKESAFAWPDSSFSVFPVLATFGRKSYHFLPLRSPYKKWFPKNQFLHELHFYFDDHSSTTADTNEDVTDDRHNNLEWMVLKNNETLFGIETFYMEKLKIGGDGINTILKWFVNDTFEKPYFPQIERYDVILPDLYKKKLGKNENKKKQTKKKEMK